MSDLSNGAQVLQTLRYLRGFLRNVSLLLQTADKIMLQKQWQPEFGNYCVPSLSYSILNPDDWFPPGLIRAYTYHDKSMLLTVSAILDDRFAEFVAFTEPVLCITRFDNLTLDGKLDWKTLYQWSLWMAQIEKAASGEVTEDAASNWEERYPFDRVIGIRRPLVEIDNEEKLLQTLIAPVLARGI